MQYKGLEITAFEQTPGKWCARIVGANGKPLEGNHRQLLETLTSSNQPSAVDALTLALETVDAAGPYFRTADRGMERFWRVLSRARETSGHSAYPLSKKKPRRRRVSAQAGVTDYILREQEMSKFIRRELWLSNRLSAAHSAPETESTK
jgi:hypothetical protein